MNYLIAKSGKNYHKVLSQRTDILDKFDSTIIDSVIFSPNYKLDEDQWFRIDDFSTKPFSIAQCQSNFSTTSLNQITNTIFEKIKILCIIQNGQVFFQKVTPNLFVRRKKFLDASGTPKIVEHRRQLEILKESDAIYQQSTNTLYFKNLSKIKSIFPGIEELHREATQAEVDTFLNNEFIELNGYVTQRVGSSNRKRIADIGVKFEVLAENKKQILMAYVRSLPGFETDESNNFIIDSEEKLKKLLFALDQRYYRSDIYEEDRLANSILVV